MSMGTDGDRLVRIHFLPDEPREASDDEEYCDADANQYDQADEPVSLCGQLELARLLHLHLRLEGVLRRLGDVHLYMVDRLALPVRAR